MLSPNVKTFRFQLTYDYKFDFEDEENKIPCLCGAPNCRKWMNWDMRSVLYCHLFNRYLFNVNIC